MFDRFSTAHILAMALPNDSNLNVFISRAGEMAKYPKGRTFVDATLDAIRQAGFVAKEMGDFTASPDPPAELCINAVQQCSIYVGLLGMKWGSQVRDREDAISYTQLEFEAAQNAEIFRLIFLLDEEAELPLAAAIDHENGPKQQEFRKAVKEAGVTCKSFKTADELQRLVKDSLDEVKEKLQSSPSSAATGSDSQPTFPREYRQWLQKECTNVGLLGIKPKEGQSILLNNVYVPLTTVRPYIAEADFFSRLLTTKSAPPPLMLDLLGKGSFYMSGDAGTGKSTFCRWVSLLLALDDYPPHSLPPPDGYHEKLPSSLRGKVPLLVPLREFWENLPCNPGRQHLSANELAQSLEQWLGKVAVPGLTWSNVEAHLNQGTMLMIWDGADELPESDTRAEGCSPRQMLFDGLSQSVQTWVEKGNRVLLTSRPYGLDAEDLQRLQLPHHKIGDLSDELQTLLVQRWFTILKGDMDEGKRTAGAMLDELANQPERQPITSNPLLLTAACIVFGDGAGLPQHKHELYERIVNCVLKSRFPKDQRKLEMVANELAVIAHGMHTGEHVDPPGQLRKGPYPDASRHEIDTWLREYHEKRDLSHEAFETVVSAREQLLSQTGLLLPRPGSRAAYCHLSFQEFFAARRLVQSRKTSQLDKLVDIFLDRAPNAQWHNTLSFLFGAVVDGSRENGAWLASKLLEHIGNNSSWKLAVITGNCLFMLLRKGIHLRDECEEQFRQICLDAIENEIDVEDRWRLGMVLGWLGDPRIVADLRDHSAVDGLGRPAYVEVPAGTYRVGKEYELLELKESFYITRMLVTNSQYRMFWDPEGENGYHNRRWWSDEGWRWRKDHEIQEPGYWRGFLWNNPNQPVVGISFWEAEAFGRWAGCQIPNKNQWELAARSSSGLTYPWGDEWEDGICNSQESGLGGSSTVGLFPRSRSTDFGLEDMAGNVWEWTAECVLLGGSFHDDAGYCRSSLSYVEPGDRSFNLGFRLAAVPSSK